MKQYPDSSLLDSRMVENAYGLNQELQGDLRAAGKFCAAMRIGGRYFYRREALEAWLDAQVVRGDSTDD